MTKRTKKYYGYQQESSKEQIEEVPKEFRLQHFETLREIYENSLMLKQLRDGGTILEGDDLEILLRFVAFTRTICPWGYEKAVCGGYLESEGWTYWKEGLCYYKIIGEASTTCYMAHLDTITVKKTGISSGQKKEVYDPKNIYGYEDFEPEENEDSVHLVKHHYRIDGKKLILSTADTTLGTEIGRAHV